MCLIHLFNHLPIARMSILLDVFIFNNLRGLFTQVSRCVLRLTMTLVIYNIVRGKFNLLFKMLYPECERRCFLHSAIDLRETLCWVKVVGTSGLVDIVGLRTLMPLHHWQYTIYAENFITLFCRHFVCIIYKNYKIR